MQKVKKKWIASFVALSLTMTMLPLESFAKTNVKVEGEEGTNCWRTTSSQLEAEKSLEAQMEDLDGDGLADWIEETLGTNPEKSDTDGDGLSDQIEVCLIDTDPLKVDSDENGRADGEEDFDQDGLCNLEEIKQACKIHIADTDGDGISDGEEVNGCGTNPTLRDTDEDSLTDGEEITLGLNPLNGVSDGVTPDKLRTFEQTLSNQRIEKALIDENSLIRPAISGKVSGLIDKNVYVEISNMRDLKENRGVVGEVIEVKSQYDKASLKLDYDLSKVIDLEGEDYGNLLCICKVGDGFIPLATTYKDKHLTAQIEEPGHYLVVNTDIFLKDLGIDVLGHVSTVKQSAKPKVQFGQNMQFGAMQFCSVLAGMEASLAEDETVLDEAVTTKADASMADIVFVVDTPNLSEEQYAKLNENIDGFTTQLINDASVNVNFAVIDSKNASVCTNESTNWFSMYDTSDLKETIDTCILKEKDEESQTLCDGLQLLNTLDWRENANKFIILLTAPALEEEANVSQTLEMLSETGIKTIKLDADYDFSQVIQNVSQAADEGEWVVLDNYDVIQLDKLAEDTDQDGLKDEEELGETKSVDLGWAVEQVLEAYDVSETAVYDGIQTIEVTSYATSPVLADTDYDGIPDSSSRDLIKRSSGTNDPNTFSGKLYSDFEDGVNVSFKVDYRDFFEKSNQTYQKDLSVLGALYAALAYENGRLTVNKGTTLSGNAQTIFEGFGLEDFDDYNLKDYFTDDDLSEVMLGHHFVSYNGESKDIVVVNVRGTNGTVEEWSSNFDVGANTANYWDRGNKYWRDKSNHKGFDVAANRLYDHILNYIESNTKGSAEKVVYIVGHSRGAGIANILGKKFEDLGTYKTYTYTFAAPNATTSSSASNYRTIFNVVNSDDIIPALPLDSWGFKKYGTTKSISVESYYEDSTPFTDAEGTFEWLAGGTDYNNDGGTANTLNAFRKVASTREGLYVYDTTDEGYVNPHNKYHTTYSGAQKELTTVNQELKAQRLDRYSKTSVIHNAFYSVSVRYKPAFVMQVLANMTTGTGPTLGYDVAGKYAKAKAAFVASSGVLIIGGMAHPHYPETYYLIARNDFKKLS